MPSRRAIYAADAEEFAWRREASTLYRARGRKDAVRRVEVTPDRLLNVLRSLAFGEKVAVEYLTDRILNWSVTEDVSAGYRISAGSLP
jgi:hypothetical protein